MHMIRRVLVKGIRRVKSEIHFINKIISEVA